MRVHLKPPNTPRDFSILPDGPNTQVKDRSPRKSSFRLNSVLEPLHYRPHVSRLRKSHELRTSGRIFLRLSSHQACEFSSETFGTSTPKVPRRLPISQIL